MQKATLAVVPVNPDNETQSKEYLFEDAFERGKRNRRLVRILLSRTAY